MGLTVVRFPGAIALSAIVRCRRLSPSFDQKLLGCIRATSVHAGIRTRQRHDNIRPATEAA